MWELEHKEGWVPENLWFWIVVLEKTLESPLDSKKIKPKGNQPWIFIGRIDAQAETPTLWPSDAKIRLTRKNPNAGKIEGKGKGGCRGWDSWLAWLTDSMDMNLSKFLWETVEDRGAWCAAVHGVVKTQTQLSNWATTKIQLKNDFFFSVGLNFHAKT